MSKKTSGFPNTNGVGLKALEAIRKADGAAIQTVIKIRRGLKLISQGYPMPPWDLGRYQAGEEIALLQKDVVFSWERALWRESLTMLGAKHWCACLLATYCNMIRTQATEKYKIREPIPAVSQSMRGRWHTNAFLYNSIVSGLALKWGSKAYLVLQALAGKKIPVTAL